jgi:DNA polymerase-3 subunit gamma/tau
MRGATAPRLLLEVVCARLLLPSASDTESALLQRVERIEMRLDMSIPDGEVPAAPKQFTRKSTAPEPAATTPPPSPPAQPQPAPASTPEPTSEAESKSGEPEPESAPVAATGEPNAAAVRSMWTTVRDKVRERSRTTEVMLSGAIVRAVEGDTLVLSHESAPLAKRLTEQRNADVIRDALKDALGVDWKIRCETGGPAAPAAPEPAVVAPTPRQRPSRTIPEPPPPPPPPPEDDEESMLAEVSSDTSETPRRDPEEVALELLQTELGARPIDGAK